MQINVHYKTLVKFIQWADKRMVYCDELSQYHDYKTAIKVIQKAESNI